MAISKSNSVINNNTTLTAGAGNTTTSLNNTANYGTQIGISITNGGTGPTVAAQVQIQTSDDNSNWYNFGGALVASTTASAVTSWSIDIPIGVMYLQFVSGSNTGQNVTLRISVGEVTSL